MQWKHSCKSEQKLETDLTSRKKKPALSLKQLKNWSHPKSNLESLALLRALTGHNYKGLWAVSLTKEPCGEWDSLLVVIRAGILSLTAPRPLGKEEFIKAIS